MLTRSPSRTRRGATRTVTPRRFAPARTTVPLRTCFATTVPFRAVGAALADPTASRKAATASGAVHFMGGFLLGCDRRPRRACGRTDEEAFDAKKSRPNESIAAAASVDAAAAAAAVAVRGRRGGHGVGAAVRAGGRRHGHRARASVGAG